MTSAPPKTAHSEHRRQRAHCLPTDRQQKQKPKTHRLTTTSKYDLPCMPASAGHPRAGSACKGASATNDDLISQMACTRQLRHSEDVTWPTTVISKISPKAKRWTRWKQTTTAKARNSSRPKRKTSQDSEADRETHPSLESLSI